MPKRIVMIPPFDVLTGNLSGGQDLKYALNNNPAFDAPEGKVNYARNYKPRYIGSKRGSDGLTYYSVRTKNGVNTNAQTKLAMALLGATGAMRAAILRDDTLRTPIEEKYEQAIATGYISRDITFSRYVFDTIYRGLQRKYAAITFLVPNHGQTHIKNPWVYTNQQVTAATVPVSDEILVKFWPQLASSPITFTVEGAKGVAHNGDTFANVVSRRYNVLDLSIVEGTGEDVGAVKLGELYVGSNSSEHATVMDIEQVQSLAYVLTDEFISQG